LPGEEVDEVEVARAQDSNVEGSLVRKRERDIMLAKVADHVFCAQMQDAGDKDYVLYNG
jgi:hypothetical protein